MCSFPPRERKLTRITSRFLWNRHNNLKWVHGRGKKSRKEAESLASAKGRIEASENKLDNVYNAAKLRDVDFYWRLFQFPSLFLSFRFHCWLVFGDYNKAILIYYTSINSTRLVKYLRLYQAMLSAREISPLSRNKCFESAVALDLGWVHTHNATRSRNQLNMHAYTHEMWQWRRASGRVISCTWERKKKLQLSFLST